MWQKGTKLTFMVAGAAAVTGLGLASSARASEKDTKPPEIPT